MTCDWFNSHSVYNFCFCDCFDLCFIFHICVLDQFEREREREREKGREREFRIEIFYNGYLIGCYIKSCHLIALLGCTLLYFFHMWRDQKWQSGIWLVILNLVTYEKNTTVYSQVVHWSISMAEHIVPIQLFIKFY